MKKKYVWLLTVFSFVISLFWGVLKVNADDPTFQFEFIKTGKKLTIDPSSIVLDPSIEKNLNNINIVTPDGVKLISYDVPRQWSKEIGEDSFIFVVTSNRKVDAIKAFLTSLVFEVNTEEKVNIGINFNNGRIRQIEHDDGSIHYYKPVYKECNWYEAYNLAQKETYNGLTGYLMTITNQKESDEMNLFKFRGWSAGTRQTYKDGSFIHGESDISETYDDYGVSNDEWYWADGPEAGMVYGKGKSGDVSIPGILSLWYKGGPDNNIGYYVPRKGEPSDTEEAAMLWGYDGWRDYTPVDSGKTGNNGYVGNPNQAYYVEFSEYNGQKIEASTTVGTTQKVKVPQKVSLKFYDIDDNLLPIKEIILDEEIMIGKSYDLTSQLPDIPGYVIDLSRSTGITGTITDQVINAKAVYRSRTVTEHADAEIKLNEDLGSLSFINIDTSATMEFEDVTLNGNQQTVREKSPLAHIRVDDSRKYKIKGWDVLAKYKDDGFSKHNFKLDLNPVSTNTLTLNTVTLSDTSQTFIKNVGSNLDSDFEIKLQPQLTIPGDFNTLGEQKTQIEWSLIPEI